MVKINVVVADDHPIVRRGLRKLLEREADIVVLGEAGDGEEALQLVADLEPDLLLLDLAMPRKTGVEVAQQLRREDSPVRVLAISSYHDKEFILHVLENGADGYVTKDEAQQQIIAAVRAVFGGAHRWLSPRVAARLGGNTRKHS